ncbi:hypothetical protein CRG98_039592 [Punica granatum]|uniref:Uncharacterized protein n=1 Tax=Punica granatum TaxID=22663 RepID=A0A2I0I7R7_PUNGR|nr:hypothetical protein CRG98_039592 [Punica granatum]
MGPQVHGRRRQGRAGMLCASADAWSSVWVTRDVRSGVLLERAGVYLELASEVASEHLERLSTRLGRLRTQLRARLDV